MRNLQEKLESDPLGRAVITGLIIFVLGTLLASNLPASGLQSWIADLVLLDPDTVGSAPPRLVEDLPGGSIRLTADSVGVARTWVNGVTTVLDGRTTGSALLSILKVVKLEPAIVFRS